jgi:hypothetical protein
LVAGEPTVDVGIYLPETDDERYNTRVPLDTLMARFDYAKEIFGDVGVQLNMLWIKKYEVPDTSWLTIQSKQDAGRARRGRPGEYVRTHARATKHPHAEGRARLRGYY